MPDIWFTADTHWSHKNIIDFDRRPFFNIKEHDEALVTYFNELIRPDDMVFFLGDVCMGVLTESLEYARQINGKKYLIPGNHDRVSHVNSVNYRAKFRGLYEDIFTILDDNTTLLLDGKKTNFSHFPYEKDHFDEPRYMKYRMQDDGTPLVHDHTHAKEKVSFSVKGTKQINVGVPAWKWRPANIDSVIALFEDDSEVS